MLTDAAGQLHSVRDTARRLLAGVSDEERAAWRASTPVEWADESHAVTTDPETEYCTWKGGSCAYARDNRRLDRNEPERTILVDAAYLDHQAPAVRRRRQQAAVRLAALLDRVLGAERTGTNSTDQLQRAPPQHSQPHA